ncbi:MAG: DUF2807 domain-containing protein [Bacteroidales bacterium]|nr:DUF2807 domain-containing protein [Bacteroidales bacterium]MBP5517093.1 DUF2807 domain-containing protein [Bacteroidales bacterium]
MKKIFASLLLVSAILLAASSNAQNSKSGKVIVVNSSEENLANKTYKFSSLNGVRAGGVFQVEVTRGRSGKVTVYAPAKTLEHIIVSESGGILILRVENGYNISDSKNKWFSRTKNLKGPVKVVADLASLTKIDLSGAATLMCRESFSEKSCKIDLSGAAKARLNKLSADIIDFDLSGAAEVVIAGSWDRAKCDLSGASKLFLTGNVSDKLDADLSGASILNASGKTDNTALDCSGASIFKGSSFQTKELAIELSGASKADINVTKRISGEVSGASTLVYHGDPDKVLIERSRGAAVTHK